MAESGIEISAQLAQQVQDGKAVLFLGAGASLCARDSGGNAPPGGRKLGELLADKFLGHKFRDAQLNQIAELAISESDLVTVQEFIQGVFEPFEPSAAHSGISQFKWAGLATTNYDRLIEKAYEANPAALQIPKPFIENGDRVEDHMRDPKGVMLLKLHGCITRLATPSCPLILTTDQYVTHRQGRSRIFDHLKHWAYELPLIFCGSSLQDPDIRAILLELTSLQDTRPRYYFVAPKIDDIELRFWESKRITGVKATFEQFIQALDSAVPKVWRALPIISSQTQHPIKERFSQHSVTLSRNCQQFLDAEVDYVKAITTTGHLDPRAFYRGHNKEWSAVEQGLDVRRLLADTILSDEVLKEDAANPRGPEFVLIKAHAGAGKTILMRRIAWDAAHDYDALCLFLRPSGSINTAALQEIINVCKERVYLFVDDSADRVRELQGLIRNIEHHGKLLTIVAAERVNEWNVCGAPLAAHVTSEYELKYLSNFEINKLLSLLTTHKALGTLEGKTLEEQKAAFREIAGRQLLVALHEATFGKPFEDIIEDEFRTIVPLEAQKIYLTICTLNRLGVPVRAGIIARLHGVRFEEFQERLFRPLEHVVSTIMDNAVRDYMYVARHPFIAEIVFERILNVQEERYDVYIKCLQSLNIDYRCDRKAFRLMLRGRMLLDMFSNPELVRGIYQIADPIAGEDGAYFHQKGLYHMHHGDLGVAGQLFAKAESLSPNDPFIKHSRAELLLKTAEGARTKLERDKHLREAASIAVAIKRTKVDSSHAYHTLIKIDVERLKEVVTGPPTNSDEPEIEAIVQRIEKNLSEGMQTFPGDAYLLTAEAELAALLDDSDRVVASLKKAFDANPRTSFIAIRLAAHYRKAGKAVEAKDVFEKALNANRNDRNLHYQFARYLIDAEKKNGGELLAYHLQRAFAPGDANYDAQILYGRQLYLNGEREESRKVFGNLREARVAPEFKSKLLYPVEGTFYGAIVRIEGSYAYVSRDGTNDWVYVHRSNVDDSVWSNVSLGVRCRYRIAFNFYGTGALDLVLSGA